MMFIVCFFFFSISFVVHFFGAIKVKAELNWNQDDKQHIYFIFFLVKRSVSMFSHIFFTGKQLMRLGIETLQKGSNLKGKEKKYLPFLYELTPIKFFPLRAEPY